MNDWLSAAIPSGSVLLGAAITYVTNVRQRHRVHTEEVFHEAIAAIAAARAARDYTSAVHWPGASPEEATRLNSQLAHEHIRDALRAEMAARVAVARASAHDSDLAHYLGVENGVSLVVLHAQELESHLMRRLARGG